MQNTKPVVPKDRKLSECWGGEDVEKGGTEPYFEEYPNAEAAWLNKTTQKSE